LETQSNILLLFFTFLLTINNHHRETRNDIFWHFSDAFDRETFQH
jgi:hypothetical protein